MYVSQTETSLYLAGEQTTICRERKAKLNGTRKLVIMLHGHGGNSIQFQTNGNWSLGQHIAALTDKGYVCVGIDAGGPNGWGGATAMAAIDACYTYFITGGRCLGPKVGIQGWSMGGLTGLNWIKRNPAKVAFGGLWAPATDLQYHHAQGGATATEIDTAYGGAGSWLANSAPYDPLRDFASYSALNVPIRIWHSDDDTVAPYAKTPAFVAAANNPNLTLTTVTGSGHFPFMSVPYTTLPPLYDAADWD